jgi:hypothetical protein
LLRLTFYAYMIIRFYELYTQKSFQIIIKTTFFISTQSGLSIGARFVKNFDYLCKGPTPPPYGENRQKKFFFQGMTIHTPIESPD